MNETASRFAVRTCGIPAPPGAIYRPASETEAAAGCALCAGAMTAGDPCLSVTALPDSFTNQPAMSAGSVICSSCDAVTEKLWLQRYATGIVFDGEIYPIRKAVDLAFWMSEPPSVPYVLLASTAKVQHIYWQAQVSMPGPVGIFCLGGRNYPIRYPAIQRAWRAAVELRESLQKAIDDASTRAAKNALPKPQPLLLGAYDSMHAGEISRHASAEQRHAVLDLNPGEQYLFARVQSQPLSAHTRPDPIFRRSQA